MGNVEHLNELLQQAQAIKFNCLDKIVLSAERSSFKKLNPNIEDMLIYPPHLLNKGGVPYQINSMNGASMGSDDGWNRYKQQNIEGGVIRVYPNAIKLYILNIGDVRAIRSRFQDAIRYLIEHGFLLAKSTKPHVINYYLRKFRFNEVEFNSFFESPALFHFLHDTYNFLEYDAHVHKLVKFGSRKSGESMEKAVEIDIDLSSHETSIYLWQNDSSKLYLYNIQAENDKRDDHRPGDTYKAELTVRRDYLKKMNRSVDCEILKCMEYSELFQKAYDAIVMPIRVERADAMMRKYLNKKRRF